ncbi:peptide MFS transporter [Ferruginibacter yonginensis]|uniref:Peptide MFS transporter n=1 Tax=Ferruginibacter yonginensis TaxID=1310416 RepID=A0ABV8QTV8_9BACT
MMEQQAQKGHPKGLYVLFATEFWERFSYYGMRAIFILFMTKYLFFNKSYASNIYGTYTGLVYLTPLIGGYVADRYWGNRKSIFVGGILMAIGQFLLFTCASLPQGSGSSLLFLWAGLGFLIFGNGFFKPNISTMVGQLYPEGDVRKDGAYSIFYMGINAGAFFAPLICGYLGENVDFKWGFFSAGVGMLVGLVIFYLTKDKYVVAPDGTQLGVTANKLNDKTTSDEASNSGGGFSTQQLTILIGGIAVVMSILYFILKVDFWGSLIYGMTIVAPFVVITDKSLTKIEKDRLWVIILIMIFVVFFWMCFEQAGASLTFFADEQTNRKIFGWEMPASYFQSFNAGFIVLLAPIISIIWLKLKHRNPAAPYKQSFGLGFLALGFLFIAIGSKNIPNAGASIIWLTGLYFLHTIGELCLSPIGLSMVNKLTPGRFTSLMMGVWFLAIATGNKLAGAMSSLYPEQQNISAQFEASNVKMNGVTVNWDSVTNVRDISQNSIWDVQLVKKSADSKEVDSLVSITTSDLMPNIVGTDSVRVKRFIPGKMSEEKVKKIFEKYGDKEPKFIFGKGKEPSTYYILRNEMYAKNNEVKLEVWNTNPKAPVFLGIEIKDLFTYFMVFVALSGLAAFILFILSNKLQKMMHGVK